MALVRRFPDTRGVLVTGVRPGRAMEEAKPEVRPGDVILEVAGKPVLDLAGFAAIVAGLPDGKALVGYRRGQESVVTLLELKPEDKKQRGGELAKAWLGLKTQVLTTPLAEALGLKGTRGFRVTQVLPWTKAAEAGLQAGDVIVSLAGEKLEAYRPRDSQELVQLVEQQPIGKAVPVEVLRGKEKLTLQVTMQGSPASTTEVETATNEAFEFKVREITFLDRVERRWKEDQQGVLVTEATMGGWANMAGLRSDDLIVSIEDQPTPGAKAFEAAMKQVLTARPKVVRIFVRRGYGTQFVFIEPDWSTVPQATPTTPPGQKQ
jgi:serine protease Do